MRARRVIAAALLLAALRLQAAAQETAPIPVGVALLDVGAATGKEAGGAEMFALRRIFQTIGIRFDALTSAANLAGYRVVFTAGALPNGAVTRGFSNGLYDFVESGGTLVSAGEAGSDLFQLFGIQGRTASRRRYRLTLAGSDPALTYAESPRERIISLGNGARHFFDDVIWTHGAILRPEASALGLFEDGSCGFSVHPYGRGRAYLLGVSYVESVLLAQAGGSYNAERQYVNGIEPSADMIMLALKAIVEASLPVTVSVSPLPYALPAALVLTHDVDAQTSFLDSLKFAALERRFGVRSTFFITTKYFTDSTDRDYFNVPENVDAVRRLKAEGWDIGSHTVSHLPSLGQAPEGDPAVTRATYQPLTGITVWGEVRVSKELLDRALPGQSTIAYRSGDLAFPPSLIRILEGAGYEDDSTYSANAVLSAFPYFALRNQNVGSAESSIVEIPVTLDDSQGYLTPTNGDSAVKNWLEVIRANARREGMTVLLIHPSDTRTQTYKLRAQEAVMKAVSAMGGWMGDLSFIGRFWRDRAALRFSTLTDGAGGLVIHVEDKGDEINPALGFSVTGPVQRVVVEDREGVILPFLSSRHGGRLSLGRAFDVPRER